MSGEAETKEVKGDGAGGQTEKPAVTIPSDVSEKLLADAVAKAAEIATTKANEVIEAQNKRLRAAMGDAPTGPTPNEALLQRFFEDPSSVLSVPYIRAKEEGAKEVLETIRTERQREKANEKATHEVLSVRPDIYTNEAAMELIGKYWSSEDDKLSPSEQLKSAVKKYDLLMEKSGAGDAEKRVAAAASLTKTASTTSQDSNAGASYTERSSAANASWQEKRVEEYRKKHGGQYPGTIRR